DAQLRCRRFYVGCQVSRKTKRKRDETVHAEGILPKVSQTRPCSVQTAALAKWDRLAYISAPLPGGCLAQLVEHRLYTARVGGSIPSAPTSTRSGSSAG